MPGTAPGAYGAAMRRVPMLAALLIALLLAACGDSAEDKAQATVCDSRDDIAEQVNDLKGVTAANFTTEAVKDDLSEIKDDLSDMANAQKDLSDDRRQEVEAANQAFAGAVDGVVKDIGTSTSAEDAASTVSAALQQLGASYEQAFSRIDC